MTNAQREVIEQVAALERATGLRFADYARNGCQAGRKCNCTHRTGRCRAWDAFDRAVAKVKESE